jgi:curved DNA-binding protein CbpA
MTEDHRAILGVGPGASAAEIRAAYRRAAKTAHPDQGGSSEAFQRVRVAADLLLEELKSGRPARAERTSEERDLSSLEGDWMSASAELRAVWGLTREPVIVFAPQKIGLSPFSTGRLLNVPAYNWLVRSVGPRGEAWDFHIAGSLTRLFFKRADDAQQFQLRFF